MVRGADLRAASRSGPLELSQRQAHDPFGRPMSSRARAAAGAAQAVVVQAQVRRPFGCDRRLPGQDQVDPLLLPKLKLLTTFGTMAVSIAAYALLWGWEFAVGFVVLLLVHEMGHVIALRREGIKASPPMFVPFLGAVISARSLGDNATAEARVGLAGPILGSIGAAACVLIWHLTGSDLWRALAYTGFLLNLFNLLPVVPLDGGRAMAAMAPWMWFLGFAALIPLLFFFPNPIFLIIFCSRAWRRSGAGS